MANPEHLQILQQGVEVWNQWRRHNPDIKPDLCRTNVGLGDFRRWKTHGVYQQAFDRLLRDLKAAERQTGG
jgi:hypothetical protein